MKIKIETERECCEREDLKPYLGSVTPGRWNRGEKMSFCVHCGQVWSHTRVVAAEGGFESDMERVDI